MLYVSHVLGDKVGVTDTDDGVTQYIRKDTLVKSVSKYNLQVQGVVGDEVTIIVNGKEEKGVLGVPKGVKLQGSTKPTKKPVKSTNAGKKTQITVNGKKESAILGVPKGVQLQGPSNPPKKPVKAHATGKKTQVIIDGKVEEAVVGPIKFD